MCWADKLVLVLFVAAMAFLLFIAHGWVASADGFNAIGQYALWIFLPLWAFLRLIDWVTGGPQRRRGGVTVYPVD